MQGSNDAAVALILHEPILRLRASLCRFAARCRKGLRASCRQRRVKTALGLPLVRSTAGGRGKQRWCRV